MNYEEKFERFRKLGGQLGLMIPKTTFTIRVDNPDGSYVERKSLSRSWTRNAYNWMYTQLCGLGADANNEWGNTFMSFRSTTGTIYDNLTTPGVGCIYIPGQPTPISSQGGYAAAAGLDAHGIVAGTGVIAEDFDDYALGVQIAHGNDAAELSHNACGYTKAWDGGTLEMQNTFVRIFNNNSGGQIDIGEIGMYASLAVQYSGNAAIALANTMVIRDLVDPVVSVVDTAQMTVTYDIILTYPE